MLIKLNSLKKDGTIIGMDNIPSELAAAISQLFIINKIMIKLSTLTREIEKNSNNTALISTMPTEFINIIRRLHPIIVFIKQISILKNLDFDYDEFTELETMVAATYHTNVYKAPSAQSVLNETHKNNF